MRKVLILLMLVTISSARIHTIYPDQTKTNNYFYTIPTIIEQIPELTVRAFDATDEVISRHGRSSTYHNSVGIAIDGSLIAPLQDGVVVTDMLPVPNEAIDSIVVYTGVHTMKWNRSNSIVIDVITKDISENSITGTAYTGSEVGDPTVLLRVMDEELIPYNKEQVTAGEIWGTVMTKNVGHGGGVSGVYMDRYSNGHERERTERYGEKNSGQSMEEIRKAHYSVQFPSTLKLNVAVVDYNLFRFDRFYQRHNYFEGTRGDITLSDTYEKDRLFSSINLGATFEDGTVFETERDSINGFWWSGSLLGTVGYRSPKQNRYSISVHTEHLFGSLPIVHADSMSDRQLFQSPSDAYVLVTGTMQVPDDRFTVQIGSEPSLKVASTIPLTSQSSISGAAAIRRFRDFEGMAEDIPVELNAKELYSSVELEYIQNIGDRTTITAASGFENAPTQVASGEHLQLGSPEFIPWGETTVQFDKFITASFYGSNYELSGNFDSEFIINGLTVGGGVSIQSKSYWNSETAEQQPFSTSELSSTTSLPSHITGRFSLSYKLFKDHFVMAIAIRDIGDARVVIPNGSMIGPTVVSKFSLTF